MGRSTVKIAPSILAADFARLGQQVTEAEKAGADRIHIDVMDGHFVPNISIGIPVVRSLRPVTSLPLETHLMIADPDRYLEAFAAAGSDTLIVHQEANPHLHRSVQSIKALGKRAGVAVNPSTPAAALEEILPEVDLVLIMTVNPGYGGQKIIVNTFDKIRRARKFIGELGASIELEVDGGVDAQTVHDVLDAGADVLVAGSAIFGHPLGVAAGMAELQGALDAHSR